jgi:hypothetical protein
VSYTEMQQRDVAADAARLGVRVAADKHGVTVATVSRWLASYGEAEKAYVNVVLKQERLNARREQLLEDLFAATEKAVRVADVALSRAQGEKLKAREVLDLTRAAAIALDKAAAVAGRVHAADWEPPEVPHEAEIVEPPAIPAVLKEVETG